MPQGIQIWDAAGQLVVDTPDFLTRYVGQISLGNGHGAGSVNVPEFDGSWGTPWFIVCQAQFFAAGTDLYPVTELSRSGTTLSWTAGDACEIIYGVH